MHVCWGVRAGDPTELDSGPAVGRLFVCNDCNKRTKDQYAEQKGARASWADLPCEFVLAHRLVAVQAADSGAFKACFDEDAMHDDMVVQTSRLMLESYVLLVRQYSMRMLKLHVPTFEIQVQSLVRPWSISELRLDARSQ